MTMKGPVSLFKSIVSILKDYCLNSSLAGVRYIADDRYHPVERIFWLICITISSFGSYYLIKGYQDSLESDAISMVEEGVDPREEFQFPSIGVCELGYSKQEYPKLTEIINGFISNSSLSYSYDVEDFLLRVIYQNLYTVGSLTSYCQNCDDCLQCPTEGYIEYAQTVRSNCTDLFSSCRWNDVEFDCSRYFLPIKTTMGICFLMNSIQIIERDSYQWFNTRYGPDHELPEIELVMRNPAATFILNPEDIPHMILTALQFSQEQVGSTEFIKLKMQPMGNDPSVRSVGPEYRHCLFPDEQKERQYYRYYSFSVCATECIRNAQLRVCNCTHHNMIYDAGETNLSCNYEGLICLDKNELLYPQTTILQSWHTNGLVCRCWPSCDEVEITIVEQTSSINKSRTDRMIRIGLQSRTTRQYRRQAVRNSLDLVVTIGGILGLISGASILSAVELVYFFTIRLIGTFYIKWNAQRQRQQEKLQPIQHEGRKYQRLVRWHPNEHLKRNKRSLKS